MAGIVSGVNVMNKFVPPQNKTFSKYISYMDREEARHENFKTFNMFNNYMGDPEKSTGLFTKNSLIANQEEVDSLKSIFNQAQDNGSFLWQTVISFDNRWLAENGLYSFQTKVLDEKKLKEVSTVAINKMLYNENMNQAVWSASIHYNTDNIHVHVGTVEPIPTREKRIYAQYTYALNDKNRLEKETPILDEKGNQIYEEEYRGKFSSKSLQLCKQHVVNEISNSKEQNFEINKIIREVIVKDIKQRDFINNPTFSEMFLQLYNKMPDCSKNLWNYNNNIMEPIRKEIDAFCQLYLEQYKREDFESLEKKLDQQQNMYQSAYGDSGKNYAEGKLKELYSRMGNAVLQEMRNFEPHMQKETEEKIERIYQKQKGDKQSKLNVPDAMNMGNAETKQILNKDNETDEINLENLEFESIFEPYLTKENEIRKESSDDYIDNSEIESYFSTKVYCEWNKEYKIGKSKLYSDKDSDTPPNYELAYRLLKEEADRGNVLAMYDIAEMLHWEKGMVVDEEQAKFYYENAFLGFRELNATKKNAYYEYRLGKHYLSGHGVEEDYTISHNYFLSSARGGNIYAQYSVANLYYDGKGVEQNYEEAFRWYKKSADSKKGNAYAAYEVAKMYEKGVWVEQNSQMAKQYYKNAFESFRKMEEKNPDYKLQYRLGMMLYNGKGVEVDKKQALKYLVASKKSENVYATLQVLKYYIEYKDEDGIKEVFADIKKLIEKGAPIPGYELGKIYLNQIETLYDPAEAERHLKIAAEENHEYAQYALGKLYLTEEHGLRDIEKAEHFLLQSAEQGNEYAQYALGKLYLTEEHGLRDIERAEHFLLQSAEQGNEYAQYTLGKEYLIGNNLKLDKEKAKEYLYKSAEQDNQWAQYTIGKMYMYGNGVQKNKAMATEWFLKSAMQGNEYALAALDKNMKMMEIKLSNNVSWKTKMQINKSMFLLKKGLNQNIESYKNQREHEQLIHEIQTQKYARER